MTMWAYSLAREMEGKSKEDIREILLQKCMYMPWHKTPERKNRDQVWSSKEIWDLKNKLHQYSYDCEKTGCRIWSAGSDWDGYGQTGVKGKQIKSHRASYLVFKGDIPEGMMVCHSCDNPMCIRPDHLWLGDIQDNHKDKMSKLRHAKGETAGNSKFTTEKVVKIRSMHSSGLSPYQIAKKLGESESTMQKICYRKTWKHI